MGVAALAKLEIPEPDRVRPRRSRIARAGSSVSASSNGVAAFHGSGQSDPAREKARRADAAGQWQVQVVSRSVWRGSDTPPGGNARPIHPGVMGYDVPPPLEHRLEN